MSKPYVFITMKIPDEAIQLVKNVAEVHMWEESSPCPKERLIEEAKKADALLTMVSDPIDEQVLRAGEKLKIVANMAVGYDNIDIEVATKQGIVVTNTPDVLTEATADLTFALLMTTARRIVEAANYVYDDQWRSWSPLLMAGQDIYGATMGIVGMGRIGQSVAKRGRGFDMNVLYHNRRRKPDVEQELNVQYRELDDLLQQSDFVVVLAPLTPETRNMFGQREFSLMKKSAIFINASRGPLVNEQELYEALQQKEIWGAGLDVFAEEPIAASHPLLQLNNVVALPHIGSASIQTRVAMANLAAENIVLRMNEQQPKTIVNAKIWGAHR